MKFASGHEAAQLLYNEAKRRDPHQPEFLQAVDEVFDSLSPVFDRHPEAAWIGEWPPIRCAFTAFTQRLSPLQPRS